MGQTVKIDGVKMSLEAARSVEWAGVNVAEDVRRLRAGEVTAEALLAECIDGAQPEHHGDWSDYVDAVVLAADAAGLPTRSISFTNEHGTLVELDGTLPELAQELAEHGYAGPSIRVTDDAGFTRGWVSAGDWRAA